MNMYNPRGKRSRDVYKEISKDKGGSGFIKKGVSKLYKAKKGKPVPVTMPKFGNPHASYGPRTRQAGKPQKGEGATPGSGVPQVGEGEGEEGEEIGREETGGQGRQGGSEGDGPVYGEIEKKEIVHYLMTELQLDLIKPGKLMKFEKYIYPIVANHGPKSTFTLEDTVFEAFKRHILWNPGDQDFNPGDLEESDMRYRLPKIKWKEDKDAVVIFKRDVSGSVSPEEMNMSYNLTVLIEYWLEECYQSQVRSIYLPHNHEAWEDSKQGYYTLKSSGGTRFSEAYNLILNMLEGKDYPRVEGVVQKTLNSSETDIYLIDMSDGEDWEIPESLDVLGDLMPHLTRMCYLQTAFGQYKLSDAKEFAYGLIKNFPQQYNDGKIRIAQVDSTDMVEDALKIFFGRDYLKFEK